MERCTPCCGNRCASAHCLRVHRMAYQLQESSGERKGESRHLPSLPAGIRKRIASYVVDVKRRSSDSVRQRARYHSSFVQLDGSSSYPYATMTSSSSFRSGSNHVVPSLHKHSHAYPHWTDRTNIRSALLEKGGEVMFIPAFVTEGTDSSPLNIPALH